METRRGHRAEVEATRMRIGCDNLSRISLSRISLFFLEVALP
jgi:hypothetical protein